MVSKFLEGGDKLQAALRDISRSVSRGGTLKVGFLSGATYPDGKSVAMIAAIHNWGAPSRNIPARPFFTNMVAQQSPTWPNVISTQLQATKYDVELTMNRVGAHIKGELQASIRNGPWAPIAEETTRRKGFSTPLIDTAHMLNSVAWEYEPD